MGPLGIVGIVLGSVVLLVLIIEEVAIELVMHQMFNHRGDGCLRFNYPMPSDFENLNKKKFYIKSKKNTLIGFEYKDKNITKSELAKKLGISSRTVAKIKKGEKIADRVLKKIADYLGYEISELVKIESENALLQLLCDEKEVKISGGIYHELQVRMTYNSNHIEGSVLSEDQTRFIFETNTVDVGEGIPVDDIIETVNHFRAIDYVLEVAEDELSEEIIKNLHRILKQSTKDSTLSWFAVGDYKKRANVVGGRETSKPADVPFARNKRRAKTSFISIELSWFTSPYNVDPETLNPKLIEDTKTIAKTKTRDVILFCIPYLSF